MFNEFSFLWLESLNDQYERFVAGEPSMEDFEKKLQEYAGVELRLNAVSPAEHIGPLCISTAPIKQCLLGEAASWKQQFAQKLHKEGADKLHSFDLYVRETTRKLSGKVEDLEDVRTMMDVLQEVCTCLSLMARILTDLCSIDGFLYFFWQIYIFLWSGLSSSEKLLRSLTEISALLNDISSLKQDT